MFLLFFLFWSGHLSLFSLEGASWGPSLVNTYQEGNHALVLSIFLSSLVCLLNKIMTTDGKNKEKKENQF